MLQFCERTLKKRQTDHRQTNLVAPKIGGRAEGCRRALFLFRIEVVREQAAPVVKGEQHNQERLALSMSSPSTKKEKGGKETKGMTERERKSLSQVMEESEGEADDLLKGPSTTLLSQQSSSPGNSAAGKLSTSTVSSPPISDTIESSKWTTANSSSSRTAKKKKPSPAQPEVPLSPDQEAQKMTKHATTSQVQDVSDPSLLRWHRVKSNFLPCCIRTNMDEGKEIVTLSKRNDTLIRYLGFKVPDAGVLAAASSKSLFPLNYEHNAAATAQEDEKDKNEDDDKKKSKDDDADKVESTDTGKVEEKSNKDDSENNASNENEKQKLQWSPTLMEQYLKSVRSRKGSSAAKALAERLVLDRYLVYVLERSQEVKKEQLDEQKQKLHEKLKTVPEEEEKESELEGETASHKEDKQDTNEEAKPSSNENAGKPDSEGAATGAATTKNKDSSASIDASKDTNTPTSAQPAKKVPPTKTKERKTRIKLRAGDVIEYYSPEAVACEASKRQATIVEVNPRKSDVALVLNDGVLLERTSKIRLVQRLLHGSLKPTGFTDMEFLTHFALDSTYNGKDNDNKESKSAALGRVYKQAREDMKQKEEEFWQKDHAKDNGDEAKNTEESEDVDDGEKASSSSEKGHPKPKRKRPSNAAGKETDIDNVKEETDFGKTPEAKQRKLSSSKTKSTSKETPGASNGKEGGKKRASVDGPTDKKGKNKKRVSMDESEQNREKKQLKSASIGEKKRSSKDGSNEKKPRERMRPSMEGSNEKKSAGPSMDRSPTKKRKISVGDRTANVHSTTSKNRRSSLEKVDAPSKPIVVHHPRIPRKAYLEQKLDMLDKKRRGDVSTQKAHILTVIECWGAILEIARRQDDYVKNLDILLDELATRFDRSLETVWSFLDGNQNGILTDSVLFEMTKQWNDWLAEHEKTTAAAPTAAVTGAKKKAVASNQTGAKSGSTVVTKEKKERKGSRKVEGEKEQTKSDDAISKSPSTGVKEIKESDRASTKSRVTEGKESDQAVTESMDGKNMKEKKRSDTTEQKSTKVVDEATGDKPETITQIGKKGNQPSDIKPSPPQVQENDLKVKVGTERGDAKEAELTDAGGCAQIPSGVDEVDASPRMKRKPSVKEANDGGQSSLKKRRSLMRKESPVAVYHPRIPRKEELEAKLEILLKKRRGDAESISIQKSHLKTILSVWEHVMNIARSREDYVKNLDLLLTELGERFDRSLDSIWNFLDGNKNGLLSGEVLVQMTRDWNDWMSELKKTSGMLNAAKSGAAEHVEKKGAEELAKSNEASRGDGETAPACGTKEDESSVKDTKEAVPSAKKIPEDAKSSPDASEPKDSKKSSLRRDQNSKEIVDTKIEEKGEKFGQVKSATYVKQKEFYNRPSRFEENATDELKDEIEQEGKKGREEKSVGDSKTGARPDPEQSKEESEEAQDRFEC